MEMGGEGVIIGGISATPSALTKPALKMSKKMRREHISFGVAAWLALTSGRHIAICIAISATEAALDDVDRIREAADAYLIAFHAWPAYASGVISNRQIMALMKALRGRRY